MKTLNNIKPSSTGSLKGAFEEGFFYSNHTYVHPAATIGPDVVLEDNVKIGPNVVILGNAHIKSGTKIYPGAIIGCPAQDTSIKVPLGKIIIGKDCKIREFATIQASKSESGTTNVGDNCYIMNYSHISHDATLENNVVLINSVNLGGHTHVESNVVFMANSASHQFCRIGRYSCLTPFSAIRQDLTPFGMFSGQPGKYVGLNLIALKRAGFTSEDINAIKKVGKLYFQDKEPLAKMKKIIQDEEWAQCEYVKEFVNFIENSDRGISRRCFSY